jgi:hypothetical protein
MHNMDARLVNQDVYSTHKNYNDADLSKLFNKDFLTETFRNFRHNSHAKRLHYHLKRSILYRRG